MICFYFWGRASCLFWTLSRWISCITYFAILQLFFNGFFEDCFYWNPERNAMTLFALCCQAGIRRCFQFYDLWENDKSKSCDSESDHTPLNWEQTLQKNAYYTIQWSISDGLKKRISQLILIRRSIFDSYTGVENSKFQ